FEIKDRFPKGYDRINVRADDNQMGPADFLRLAFQFQLIDERVELLGEFGVPVGQPTHIMADYSHTDRVVPNIEIRVMVHVFGNIGKPVDELDSTFEIFGSNANF